MSPKFTQHVDPIFAYVIDLVESIHAGAQPSAQIEKRKINDLLHRADNELGQTHAEAWALAKYALAAWIDKTLLAANQWSGRDWWGMHVLEWEHFHTTDCHQIFFVRAREAANFPGESDALETFYVCVMLGFQGFYQDSDQEQIDLVVNRFGLPPDLPTWAAEVANAIRRKHAQPSDPDDRERVIHTARPLWGYSRLLWPWLLATLLVMANMVIYSWLNP